MALVAELVYALNLEFSFLGFKSLLKYSSSKNGRGVWFVMALKPLFILLKLIASMTYQASVRNHNTVSAEKHPFHLVDTSP